MPSTRPWAINLSARACKSALILRFGFLGAQNAAPPQAQLHLLERPSGFSSCGASLERSAERLEAAVQARLDRRKRDAEHPGHFFDLQFFLEAQHEHLAIDRRD